VIGSVFYRFQDISSGLWIRK